MVQALIFHITVPTIPP